MTTISTDLDRRRISKMDTYGPKASVRRVAFAHSVWNDGALRARFSGNSPSGWPPVDSRTRLGSGTPQRAGQPSLATARNWPLD